MIFHISNLLCCLQKNLISTFLSYWEVPYFPYFITPIQISSCVIKKGTIKTQVDRPLDKTHSMTWIPPNLSGFHLANVSKCSPWGLNTLFYLKGL